MTTRIATAAGAGPDTRFFVPFTKVEENADGSVYIESVATGEVEDYHGEIVLDSASVKAFKEWTDWADKATDGASLGNIREMHQSNVAGKAVTWTHDAAAKTQSLGLQVIDAEAGKKAKARVYTGLSIGGSNVKREMREVNGKSVPCITSYQLNEVSLVDKPACPVATFTLVKRADHKESPMKLHDMFKANRLAVLAVAAKMSDQKTITIGDQVFSLDTLEKDAMGAGAACMAALKTFMGEVLAVPGDADLWTLSDILEAMRYCYSACLGVQYAMADAAMDGEMPMAAAATATTLKKSDTTDDPPEEETSVSEVIDPKPKAPEPVAPAVPPVEGEPEKQAAVDLGPVLDAIAKLAASIEPTVKALQEGGLTKAAGAQDLTQLVADVATIKKAIESLPAPPPGRAIQKTLGDGSNTGDVNAQALVKIAEDALAKAAEQGTPKGALDTMRLAFTAEVMKRL